MLADVPLKAWNKQLTSILSKFETKRLTQGVYQCGHWNFEFETPVKLEQYPSLPDADVGCYGVCDSVDQLLAKLPLTIASERHFCVSMVSVKKSEQFSRGGWRWHKWGEYIGTQNPQHEYIYDEPNIDEVFTYHVYELHPKP